MNVRTLACTTVCLLPTVICPPSAVAQKDGKRVAVEARFGYVRPTAELGRTAVLESTGYVEFGKADPGASVGAAALVHLNGPFSVRLAVDYSLGSNARGQWSCAPFVACPAVVILADGEISRTSVGGDLRYTPKASEWPVEPVVFAGAGWRWHRLRWTADPDVPIPDAFDESDFFTRVGAGAARDAGPASFFFEIETLIGPFGSEEERFIEGSVPADRNTQVDVGLVAGVRLGVG
jgi:hypothetical protein